MKSSDTDDDYAEVDGIADGLFEEDSSTEDVMDDVITLVNRVGPMKMLIGVAVLIVLIILSCPLCKAFCRKCGCCRDKALEKELAEEIAKLERAERMKKALGRNLRRIYLEPHYDFQQNEMKNIENRQQFSSGNNNSKATTGSTDVMAATAR